MSDLRSGLLSSGTGSIIDQGTFALVPSPRPGLCCPIRRTQVNDEITPIAYYMAGEMNTNAHGPDAKRMAELNSFDTDKCNADFRQLPWWQQLLGAGPRPGECIDMNTSAHAAALLLWTAKVMQGAEWDHKLKISHRFHPRDPTDQQYHHYNGWVYFYDVWSNLHYGYVGTAAGFSESALLDGAGGEQIASDLLRGDAPKHTSGVSGLRAWDNAFDRAAITAGIKLYRSKPNQVFSHDLVSLVVHSPIAYKRPLSKI